jgi:hypothetical protein
MGDSNQNQFAHEIAKGRLNAAQAANSSHHSCLTNFFVRTYKLTIDPQY